VSKAAAGVRELAERIRPDVLLHDADRDIRVSVVDSNTEALRHGDRETGRKGDGETERQGDITQALESGSIYFSP